VISLESFSDMPKALPIDRIESVIHEIRGLRVMLDADLAACYGVTTKVLNQAVRRNRHRFPDDFAFQPDNKELTILRSQIVTSSLSPQAHGGRRYRPWAFTEHGAVMVASILNSAIAIAASVEIVRSFVKMRQAIQFSGEELVSRLAQIDVRLGAHDQTLEQVVAALNNLLSAPAKPAAEIGFHVREDEAAVVPVSRPKKNVRYSPARRVRRKDSNS
jgi:hypothetical protein